MFLQWNVKTTNIIWKDEISNKFLRYLVCVMLRLLEDPQRVRKYQKYNSLNKKCQI